MNAPHAMPTLYLPHGGGPCFFMEWTLGPADTWRKMGSWLAQLGATLAPQPEAIVVFSAHWEMPQVSINSAPAPSLIYDYQGFPAHTYQLQYPAPGAPALAQRIQHLLTDAGMSCQLDPHHGLDHGVFIPFLLIYPQARIPVVQVSLQAGLDPAQHLAIGHALQPLRAENVLVVGSGMSYHNMAALLRGGPRDGADERFDAWLTATCSAAPKERDERLAQWADAPGARAAHPRAEHLLPLMVVAGAAGNDRGQRVFTDRVLGARVSAFQFGG